MTKFKETTVKIGDDLITVKTNKPVSKQKAQVALKRVIRAMQAI